MCRKWLSVHLSHRSHFGFTPPRAGRQYSAAAGSSVFEKWLNARFSSTAKIAVALIPDSKIVASHSGMWL
jgi:hypothetical protein